MDYQEGIKEIENWCKCAADGRVVFDASSGIRFFSYSSYLLDVNKVISQALKTIATPLEHKLIMQEIECLSVDKENEQ